MSGAMTGMPDPPQPSFPSQLTGAKNVHFLGKLRPPGLEQGSADEPGEQPRKLQEMQPRSFTAPDVLDSQSYFEPDATSLPHTILDRRVPPVSQRHAGNGAKQSQLPLPIASDQPPVQPFIRTACELFDIGDLELPEPPSLPRDFQVPGHPSQGGPRGLFAEASCEDSFLPSLQPQSLSLPQERNVRFSEPGRDAWPPMQPPSFSEASASAYVQDEEVAPELLHLRESSQFGFPRCMPDIDAHLGTGPSFLQGPAEREVEFSEYGRHRQPAVASSDSSGRPLQQHFQGPPGLERMQPRSFTAPDVLDYEPFSSMHADSGCPPGQPYITTCSEIDFENLRLPEPPRSFHTVNVLGQGNARPRGNSAEVHAHPNTGPNVHLQNFSAPAERSVHFLEPGEDGSYVEWQPALQRDVLSAASGKTTSSSDKEAPGSSEVWLQPPVQPTSLSAPAPSTTWDPQEDCDQDLEFFRDVLLQASKTMVPSAPNQGGCGFQYKANQEHPFFRPTMLRQPQTQPFVKTDSSMGSDICSPEAHQQYFHRPVQPQQAYQKAQLMPGRRNPQAGFGAMQAQRSDVSAHSLAQEQWPPSSPSSCRAGGAIGRQPASQGYGASQHLSGSSAQHPLQRRAAEQPPQYPASLHPASRIQMMHAVENCKNCGRYLSDSAFFCPRCGEPIPKANTPVTRRPVVSQGERMRPTPGNLGQGARARPTPAKSSPQPAPAGPLLPGAVQRTEAARTDGANQPSSKTASPSAKGKAEPVQSKRRQEAAEEQARDPLALRTICFMGAPSSETDAASLSDLDEPSLSPQDDDDEVIIVVGPTRLSVAPAELNKICLPDIVQQQGSTREVCIKSNEQLLCLGDCLRLAHARSLQSPLSFGSSLHFSQLSVQNCRPCMFEHWPGRCKKSWLCDFCHVHAGRKRPQRQAHVDEDENRD